MAVRFEKAFGLRAETLLGIPIARDLGALLVRRGMGV
jgi:hypothetical protein